MKKSKERKGFTLLELVVVIIIIGVLSTLGITQYTKVVEKSRGSEARMLLGTVRSAEDVYRIESGSYTTSMSALALESTPPSTCASSHYFTYSITLAAANSFNAVATRCTAGGKNPPYTPGGSITLTITNAVQADWTIVGPY